MSRNTRASWGFSVRSLLSPSCRTRRIHSPVMPCVCSCRLVGSKAKLCNRPAESLTCFCPEFAGLSHASRNLILNATGVAAILWWSVASFRLHNLHKPSDAPSASPIDSHQALLAQALTPNCRSKCGRCRDCGSSSCWQRWQGSAAPWPIVQVIDLDGAGILSHRKSAWLHVVCSHVNQLWKEGSPSKRCTRRSQPGQQRSAERHCDELFVGLGWEGR